MARHGLFKHRRPETVYEWVRRYQADGIAPDCGSSQAGVANRLLPPEHANAAQAQTALLHGLHRDPHQFGQAQNRWTLASLMQSCSWLHVSTLGSVCRLLHRLKISYKRGRDYVHSPDNHYEAKLALIAAAQEAARREPGRYVLVYQDEFTYYRQPTLASAYEACGHIQPLAQSSA